MECPVCFSVFTSSEIDKHVDECLSRNDLEGRLESNDSERSLFHFSEDAAESSSSNEKQKPNLAFFSMSKNDNNNDKTSASAAKTMNNDDSSVEKKEDISLSELLRPKSLETYVGQKQLLGPKSILGRLLKNGEVTSMILWGPPGCGKTSLAIVIAESVGANEKMTFVKLSAISSGVAEIKEAANRASCRSKLRRRTIIFMNDIHRFNKLQQDIFLPHLEAGAIILIGATTENPSSLNPALLSRCRLFVLEPLARDETMLILKRGISFCNESANAFGKLSDKGADSRARNADTTFVVDEDAANWLVESCNGDAKAALNSLGAAVKAKISLVRSSPGRKPLKLTKDDLRAALEQSLDSRYRSDDSKYHLISAMQKSVRAGDSNAALYWLARLMASKEDPVYIARRLVRIASEDIGFADSDALDTTVHAMHACQMIGMPECDVILSQCAVYLAAASKSRSVDEAQRRVAKKIGDGEEPGAISVTKSV